MEYPIIFSTSMVEALIGGTKNQTRRLATSPLSKCRIGDRLWVREAFYLSKQSNGLPPSQDQIRLVMYKAGGGANVYGKLRPSIHMPRWASRISLIVQDVRFQKLQDISEEDAIAEGCDKGSDESEDSVYEERYGSGCDNGYYADYDYITGYKHLWESLHGGGSWDANSEIVALTFCMEDR